MPHTSRRLTVMSIVAAVLFVWVALSFFHLNQDAAENDERIGKIEAGVAALAVAIDELKAKFPDAPIDTPEEILEDADVDVEVLPERGPVGPQGEPGVDGVDGVDGRDGRNGVDGTDGKDGTDAVLSASMLDDALAQFCRTNNCVGPTGPRGAAGTPGSPAPALTQAQINTAVTNYCAANSCVGETGATGPAGPPGADGQDAPAVVDVIITCDAGHPNDPVVCTATVIYGS